jgi:hypothetical protein
MNFGGIAGIRARASTRMSSPVSSKPSGPAETANNDSPSHRVTYSLPHGSDSGTDGEAARSSFALGHFTGP